MNTTSSASSGDFPICREYRKPFDDVAIIVAATLLLSLMVLGIIGNVLTIVVIRKSKRLRGVFNLFILSLCVSDLISAIISPLFLYRRTWGYDVWELPSFFCKLYWGTDMWTSYVTAMHILVFAILRLISLRWPQRYQKIKINRARICIFFIWTIGFLTGFIPFFIWFDSGSRPRNTNLTDARWPACTLIPDRSKQYTLYNKIAFPLHFYVPTGLIIAFTVVIGFMLLARKSKRDAMLYTIKRDADLKKLQRSAQKERAAMAQLGLIAGSFMIAYIPFSVYEIASINSLSITDEDERYWWRFGMSVYICLRFSETLNPAFYNLASPKMRKETGNLLKHFTNFWKRKCFSQQRMKPPDTSHRRNRGARDALPGMSSLAFSTTEV